LGLHHFVGGVFCVSAHYSTSFAAPIVRLEIVSLHPFNRDKISPLKSENLPLCQEMYGFWQLKKISAFENATPNTIFA
jgi:hypothetical protein